MTPKPAEILENNHHAYCLSGDVANVRTYLFETLETKWGIRLKGNPDFYYEKFETMTVDEARVLKEFQARKSFSVGGKKVFVIVLACCLFQIKYPTLVCLLLACF